MADPTLDVLVVNGPNLNSLGKRKPDIYGHHTLRDIEESIQSQAEELGLAVECFQSNSEGEIVDHLYQAQAEGCRYVIINAGALTHSSVSVRDALESVEIPFVEVHISNIHAREEFRHHSFLSPIASGIIIGCGVKGYNLALDLVADRLLSQREPGTQ